jgi:3-dehydroquinate dehydratase-1
MKLGSFKAGQEPALVAVIWGKNIKELGARAKKDGADILEVRLDKFKQLNQSSLQESLRDIKKLGLPLIATARHIDEGGEREIKEEERLHLLQSVFPYVDAIDIELRTQSILLNEIVREGQKLRKKMIISYHNLKETPAEKEITRITEKAKVAGADIVKIATFAREAEDIARLMDFTYHFSAGPIASISMGEIGSISRIIAPLFGSCLGYGYLEESAAPGQLSVSALRNQWRKYKVTFSKKDF